MTTNQTHLDALERKAMGLGPAPAKKDRKPMTAKTLAEAMGATSYNDGFAR